MTRALSICGYLLVGMGVVTLTILGRARAVRLAAFGRLLDVVMNTRSARVGIVLFWWWVGWHFLVTRPVP